MNYPYIQSKKNIEKGICETCKKEKSIMQLEWRIDWFQGNCEFEDICQSCSDKRNHKERQKQEAYYSKMEPIWKKQREDREKKEQAVRNIINELGLELKEYDNGQWSIGNKLDWWTTTGTAIERQSKNRHYLTFKEPNKIRKILLEL